MRIFFSQLLSYQDIKRKFSTIVDLGSGPGHFSRLLEPQNVQKSIMLDLSGELSVSSPVLLELINLLKRRLSTEMKTSNSQVSTSS